MSGGKMSGNKMSGVNCPVSSNSYDNCNESLSG